jgi:Tol biopolymer transport system component
MVNMGILSWTPDSKSVIIAVGEPQHFEALEVATGRREVLAAHAKYPIHDGQVSPDGKWFVFKLLTSAMVQEVCITPIRHGTPSAEKDWIRVASDANFAKPFWSPGGDLLYYYSSVDSHLCLYAQRLDPVTKRPRGEAVNVRHFHDALRVAPGSAIGYGLTADRLYIPLESGRSNIWLAEPEKP